MNQTKTESVHQIARRLGLLTARQLAEKMGWKQIRVYQCIPHGKIPCHVVKILPGGHKCYAFDIKEVEAWLALRKMKNKNQIVNKVLQEETA